MFSPFSFFFFNFFIGKLRKNGGKKKRRNKKLWRIFRTWQNVGHTGRRTRGSRVGSSPWASPQRCLSSTRLRLVTTGSVDSRQTFASLRRVGRPHCALFVLRPAVKKTSPALWWLSIPLESPPCAVAPCFFWALALFRPPRRGSRTTNKAESVFLLLFIYLLFFFVRGAAALSSCRSSLPVYAQTHWTLTIFCWFSISLLGKREAIFEWYFDLPIADDTAMVTVGEPCFTPFMGDAVVPYNVSTTVVCRRFDWAHTPQKILLLF